MKTSIDSSGVTIAFADKPSDGIRSALKANGFRWSPAGQVWWRRRVTGAADLITYLDRIMHPDRPDGNCWSCGQPGKFRPRGAATPVLCNACHAIDIAHDASAKGGR